MSLSILRILMIAAFAVLLLLLFSVFSIGLMLISFFAMMKELKKRQEFENELRNKIEELNRSNTDLEQFAYVASHDLQEPLRKIRSFGDRLVMKHAEELNEDGKNTISKIQNAAGRMQILIDDLLSFSRLINNTSTVESKDLNLLLKDVLADLEIKLRNLNAKVHAGPLPELKVVPSLIRQLFQNLIGNSLKFSRPGTDPVISIASTLVKGREIPDVDSARSVEPFYKIEISDNGIGFEEKYLDKIFIIFQRLHGKLDYEGTGIGLAVCKKIMNIHQGYITATSTPGLGATFILYFPADI
jgi:light-regulated signal transduction histidine kinase (bacteriophytochrome)